MTMSQSDAASPEAEKKEYIFKRDFRSSMRLNFNHFLIRETAGYLIHPLIPINPHARIADIGTGTGIWACDLATQCNSNTVNCGSVRIDAFDISDMQYPARAFWPPNVNFYVHDSFQSFPAEFLGQYDVVHARFMMCHVDDSNARVLLQQLLSLTKPGGWIQWFEPLPRETQVGFNRAEVGAPTAASKRLAQIWHDLDPLGTYSWVEDLKGLFTKADLQNVLQVRHEIPNYLRPLWAQSSLASTADVLPKVDMWNEKDGGLTVKFIDELQLEISQGVTVETPFQCVIGRKAQ